MRDFKYTLDFYKDDMLAHEERVKQILEKEFQANRAKWLKEKANWQVLQDQINEKIRLCALRANINQLINGQMAQWVDKISKSCLMIGALIEQDEIDRRGIQLVGVNQNPLTEKSAISIDSNCLTCLKSSAN